MSEVGTIGFWRDPLGRPGPDNMAVDSWLLEREEAPILRVYDWRGEWASLGYFGTVAQARATMPGVSLVRRATGGGLVDHRHDRTYTLVLPGGCELAGRRGGESYRVIHSALAEALGEAGMEVRLIEEDAPVESPTCFEKPVAWDLVEGRGRKVAGAGQRRTRKGLLHQGSVMIEEGVDGDAVFASLAGKLAREVKRVNREPSGEELAARIDQFSSRSWVERR
ncbi:MAG: hypothetical protein CMN05_09520 [Roseibacillus sp.]|nr:hypothetical protein [Roseibacillus sp.]MCP4730622.1 hypothetical protein [Roseibacillus sp.]MDP7306391.1 hypothetical protein [Roseibacillus sp.]MDP7496086.1 hypothetical protein [Roseibacillus sp.]MDP7655999.1 hypothetical protein [Roseibacillus sp.]|tara:strand:+ start:16968 stop:17636 length:669 start_codon:yes stop_codon:yes gene_type:complete